MNDPARILVVRRKAIGDVVVSLDVLRALRERWPSAHVALVVDRFAADVVRSSPLVDEIVVYDRKQQSSGPAVARAFAFTGWLRRLRSLAPDLTVDLMGTPQTALWTRASGAPVRVGPDKRFRTWAYTVVVPRRDDPVFAGERFLDWVRALGVDPGAWRPQPLGHPEAASERARASLVARGAENKPLVLLNASATWPAKAWPLESFARCGHILAETAGAQVGIAWAPGEEPAVDAIVQASGGAVWPLPPTTLPELAAWLDLADVLVTTDSGPKHMAVAQGTSTVTVFGSTDPRGWQPPGDDHVGLTHPVDCHPCNRLVCPVPGHPCLDDLDPERVAAAAARLIAERNR